MSSDPPVYEPEETPRRNPAPLIASISITLGLAALGLIAVLLVPKDEDEKQQQQAATGIGARQRNEAPSAPRADDAAPSLEEERHDEADKHDPSTSSPEPAAPVPSSEQPQGQPSMTDKQTADGATDRVRHSNWWDASATADALNRLVDLITSHGPGVVYVDKTARAVWVSPETLDFHLGGIPAGTSLLDLDVSGEHFSADVRALKQPRLTIILAQPTGFRYSAREAVNLIQDALDTGDSASRATVNQKVLDQLFKNAGKATGRKRR